MKKYFRLAFFLGVIGILVVIKQLKGENNLNLQMPSLNLNQTSVSANSSGPGQYKDGSYTGSVQDAYYGSIQVQALIRNGKIADVIFLQYPNDNRTSVFINSQAMSMLKQEAIQSQSASVNGISGASATSPAFQQSLADALSQAK